MTHNPFLIFIFDKSFSKLLSKHESLPLLFWFIDFIQGFTTWEINYYRTLYLTLITGHLRPLQSSIIQVISYIHDE